MTDLEVTNVEWLSNPYHAFRAARLRNYRVSQLALTFLAAASFATLSLLGSRLSLLETNAFVLSAFLSVVFIGMLVPLAYPKHYSDRVYASPLRVGLSDLGIHVDYDPRGTVALAGVDWVRPLIRWDEVLAVTATEALWGRPHQIEATRKETGARAWRVVGISPELVDRILDAWKARNDALT